MTPLLTFSFLNYIKNIDLKDFKLVEIGGGESSVYWNKLFKEVLVYEDDEGYFKELQQHNINLKKFYLNIFKDKEFKAHIKSADYIIIDNNVDNISRLDFALYTTFHSKENVSIILDNTTWNIKADDFLSKIYFKKEFPGLNKQNELTVTSLYHTKKEPLYYLKLQVPS